jgi:hypothetical protein
LLWFSLFAEVLRSVTGKSIGNISALRWICLKIEIKRTGY